MTNWQPDAIPYSKRFKFSTKVAKTTGMKNTIGFKQMSDLQNRENLPENLNLFTFLCAGLAVMAAALPVAPYLTGDKKIDDTLVSAAPSVENSAIEFNTPEAATPSIAQITPIPELSEPIELPAVPAQLNKPMPQEELKEASKKIQTDEDLAEAFRNANLIKKEKAPEVKKESEVKKENKKPAVAQDTRKVVTVQAKTEAQKPKKEEIDLNKTAPTKKEVIVAEVTPKPLPAIPLPKTEEPPKAPPVTFKPTPVQGEPLAKEEKVERPANFRKLEEAQKEAKISTSADKASTSTYTGPSIVAVSADRVWVRVGETRTVVLMPGDTLAGYAKIEKISAGTVKFDNGQVKAVGELLN